MRHELMVTAAGDGKNTNFSFFSKLKLNVRGVIS